MSHFAIYSIFIFLIIALLVFLFFYAALKTRKHIRKQIEIKARINEEHVRPTPEWRKNQPIQIKKDDVKIVGIAEPVGFWSKLVMSEKLDFLMERMHLEENGISGYWQAYVDAQRASKGKGTRGNGR